MALKNKVNVTLFSAIAAGSGCSLEGHSLPHDNMQDGQADFPNIKALIPRQDCQIEFPKDQALAPYVKLIKEKKGLLEAIDLCSSTESFQETLWEKISEAEKTGISPDGKLPGSFQSAEAEEYFIQVKKEEAEEIYASHLAHSLWLDNSGALPWKLADYSDKELKELFDPLTWFWKWNGADENKNTKDGKFEFGYLVVNSPRETFEVVKKYLDLEEIIDQKEAILKIIKASRYIRHSNNADYCGDIFIIDTLQHMSEEKISRFGCQSMAPYLISLAASINIPGRTVRGYYGGVGHRTAIFEFTGEVLAHGDDVYSHALWNTPSEELMEPYDFWKENIFIYPKFDGPESQAAHNSRIGYFANAAKYPSKLLMNSYCEKGKNKLEEFFFGYLPQEEIDSVENKINMISKNCTAIPENNPDGNGSCDSICYAQ